ncbi:GH3 auxin-responsive promoter family protein, partial [Acinetobacter baumannii]
VTIPYNDQYPLAYQSHFYEFEYLEGEKQGQIVPSWQLKQGDVVSPLITSGNGLLRYCLDDCLKVTGFLEQIPCFEFQGRRFGVDLVGEKLAPETAQQLLSQLNETESKAISLLAIDTQQ